MIPQLLLEEILNGEKSAADFYPKYGKQELKAALSDLKNSSREILSQYPVQDMQMEILKKSLSVSNAGHESDGRKKSLFRMMKYTGLAVAAVLAVCVTVPLASRNSPAGKTGSGIRVKGNKMNGQSLHLYRQSQDGANLLKDGTFASEDDVIQIAYLPGDKTYGIIFSVDGNGNISRHFPEESWQAQKLELTGNEVPLDFSYKLDAAPDYECFVFVASKEPFSLENIQNLSKKECSVEYLKKGKYSPEGCSSFVFVLNKN